MSSLAGRFATSPAWVRFALALSVLAVLLAADIATKIWAEEDLRRQGARSAVGDLLTFRYQTNSGVAFGIFRAPIVHWKRTALIVYASAVSVGLAAVLAARLAQAGKHLGTTFGVLALLTGSLGNLRDRIERGAVIDFLTLDLPFGLAWPAFNLADLYLAIGLVLCLVGLVRAYPRDPAPGP